MPDNGPTETATDQPIRVGISACLLGQEVRHDGGHSRDRYVTDTLAGYFDLVSVCPEAEMGMGTPRETIRLHGELESPRLIGSKSATDWTTTMNTWSRGRVRQLASKNLSGYIFKKSSPSCGVFRVKVYRDKGMPQKLGRGLFAAEFMKHFPLVPVEEEGRLCDAGLRENFIERVFALDRLRQAFMGRWKRGALVEFHAREKYLLMAHDPQGLKRLGQMVAAVKQHPPAEFRDLYMAEYMAVMAKMATTRKHVNALQHMAGYLKEDVRVEERRRVIAVIKDYHQGLVPLIVPMTILRHYIELHDIPYVNQQVYLNPHPRELMLRNHV